MDTPRKPGPKPPGPDIRATLPDISSDDDVYFDDEQRARQYSSARTAAGIDSQVVRQTIGTDATTGALLFRFKVVSLKNVSRATRRRNRILAEGGSQLSLVISAEASDALSAICAETGETKTEVIERLLTTSAKRRTQRKPRA